MKKLIVLATLAALPAAAMADVVISGDIGVAFVNTKNKDEGLKSSANTLDRQTGQIVFSGKEDLGNGLKTIWQVANRIDASGNEDDNAWAGRDTFIGLAGDFGTVKFGRLSNPTNSGFSGAEPFSELDINGSGVYKVGEQRLANSVRYDSPVFAGFSAAVSTQIKPENDENGAAAYASGFGLKYETGPVALTYNRAILKDQLAGAEDVLGEDLATQLDVQDGPFAGLKTTTNQASAVYSADNLTAGLAYGDVKVSGDGTLKQRGYGVFASYALGQITPSVAFWKEGKLKADGDTVLGSYNVVTLGADYALSKRTNAGVELQYQGGRKVEGTDVKIGKRNISTVYLTTKF